MSVFLLWITVAAIFVLFAVMLVHSSKVKHQKEEAVPIDDFHLNMEKEELDQEVQTFRLLVDESVEKINTQYEKIRQAQAELKVLLAQAKETAGQLAKLRKEAAVQVSGRPQAELPPAEGEGDFLNPNVGLENIAQQLNMGVGELKLRLTLLKKENLYYANRK